jgi:RNA polymerase sigma-70 factor (ECF subfamily)
MKPLETPFNLEKTIKQTLNGDVNQFKLIINEFKNHVLGIIAKYVPVDKTEELAQEAFIKAYESLKNYSGQGEFKSWIAKIAVRVCFDYWKKEYKWKEKIFSLDEINPDQAKWIEQAIESSSEESHDELIQRTEAKEILSIALNKLNPQEKLIISMIYLEGFSLNEVAKQFNWGESAVKMKSLRAKKKLKDILEELYQK